MKTKIRILSLIICSLMILTSCRSIYVDVEPPATEETTPLVEVDLEKEYFTTGEVRSEVTAGGGCMYGDSWIYVETNRYDKRIVLEPNGREIYQNVQLFRIVKANAHTGQVTSICLDPVCTHSPESNCIAVAPDGSTMALVQDIVGDWLMFLYSTRTKEYGLINTSYIYNLKTGELLNIFEQDVGDTVMTRWQSRCNANNKLYGVKHVLDYTDTGFIPGENNHSDFTPETKSYLCVYDFDTRETSELFEIPTGYSITEVTNKRFILGNESHTKYYSVDQNGENLTELDVLNFSPSAVCGTYAYGTDPIKEEFYIYDLETNTKKTIKLDGIKISYAVFNAGIVKTVKINTEEFDKYNSGNINEAREKYIAEQMKLRPEVTDTLVFEKEFMVLRVKARYTMGTVSYLITDPLGEGEEIMLCELEEGWLAPIHITPEYIYCDLITYDETNEASYTSSKRCFIDRKTGEIKDVPLLDIILPYDPKPSE